MIDGSVKRILHDSRLELRSSDVIERRNNKEQKYASD